MSKNCGNNISAKILEVCKKLRLKITDFFSNFEVLKKSKLIKYTKM